MVIPRTSRDNPRQVIFRANGAIAIGCEHPRAHKNDIVEFLECRAAGLKYIITRVSYDID